MFIHLYLAEGLIQGSVQSISNYDAETKAQPTEAGGIDYMQR